MKQRRLAVAVMLAMVMAVGALEMRVRVVVMMMRAIVVRMRMGVLVFFVLVRPRFLWRLRFFLTAFVFDARVVWLLFRAWTGRQTQRKADAEEVLGHHLRFWAILRLRAASSSSTASCTAATTASASPASPSSARCSGAGRRCRCARTSKRRSCVSPRSSPPKAGSWGRLST